jgi:serine phosphatase RsbU (regulator of sigma subunit)
MFGQDRLREAIRRHPAESAEAIQNRIVEDLRIFQGKAPQEDDMTLVVIKLK